MQGECQHYAHLKWDMFSFSIWLELNNIAEQLKGINSKTRYWWHLTKPDLDASYYMHGYYD